MIKHFGRRSDCSYGPRCLPFRRMTRFITFSRCLNLFKKKEKCIEVVINIELKLETFFAQK